jgi:arylsulfatase A-like enzyme
VNSPFNRRDFLRLAGLLPLSLAAPRWDSRLPATPSGGKNVIILVFDALSAYNIPLYGYSRMTTPNLARLAQRAIVYHNHFAGSNYTTSGTATLLTGTLPWTNRALNPNSRAADSFANRNLFSAFPDYYRASYTHNPWAYTLLRQFQQHIEQLIPIQRLYQPSYDGLVESLFANDHDIASVSWARDMKLQGGYSYSLLLSQIYRRLQNNRTAGYRALFPRGLPRQTEALGNDFLLETAIDWISELLTKMPTPFLGYFHFLPPHDPYNTSVEFYNWFKQDGYKPLAKPDDIFATQGFTNVQVDRFRRQYDEYILYVDSQASRFYSALEASGLLENTWLIITSDHGELLERGIAGHTNNTLYQPLVRIPLLVFEPGRMDRLDIQAHTSAVDLLPTLAHLTGRTIPAWTEGTILPPFAASAPEPARSIYAVKATGNDPNTPLQHASIMLVKDRYKLLYYFGYKQPEVKELIQLYDIAADPEEMVNLFPAHQDMASELLHELKSKLSEVNQPYL